MRHLRRVRSRDEGDVALQEFAGKEAAWLEDYALFMAAFEHSGNRPWNHWEPGLKGHTRDVYTVAYRFAGNAEDASDITQTVFLKAWSRLDSFDPGRRFFSWIYRMTVNASLNAVKRRKPTITLEDVYVGPGPGAASDSAAEAEDRVGKALMSLKPISLIRCRPS